ncbi:MAG TPA: recombinase-like helix-turn-helix domain-containing protein [Candidatus Acidoferrales bacterium]|nr:recombinase-like helix-turn-helix domain-containing protein [Candidatus Acidoferrales bacterium]
MEHLPYAEVTGPYQTRPPSWPPALTEFADQLEAVMATGRHELAALVEGLNERGSTAPEGAAWTQTSLRARLAELGS